MEGVLNLSNKLKQKVHAQKLQRSTTTNQKSYLEKKKVPTELMNNCLQALKHQPASQLISMLDQLPTSKTMQSPNVPSSVTDEPQFTEVIGSMPSKD
jgi:hypothetical protein